MVPPSFWARTVGWSKPVDQGGTGVMQQVVGIDISRAGLDGFCPKRQQWLVVSNDAAGVQQLTGRLEPESLVVMEASGG